MRHVVPEALGPVLELRAAVFAAVRRFFSQSGYLEIETPLRIPAPIPEAHIDAQPSGSWFLHTSPEICMKRLLCADLPRIFQICKCFRKGERGGRHLPEMTMLEWYTAGEDYTHMMSQTEALIRFVVEDLRSTDHIEYQGRIIDLKSPWAMVTVTDVFDEFGGVDMANALKQDRFDEIMGLEIEPHLGWERPVFLCDYPSQKGALARLKGDRRDLVERFELYIGGLELCNAFSELTDVEEQVKRFDQENALRKKLGKTVYPRSENFIDALSSMPEATGNALGIDRLIMLLADTDIIDNVVAFVPEDL